MVVIDRDMDSIVWMHEAKSSIDTFSAIAEISNNHISSKHTKHTFCFLIRGSALTCQGLWLTRLSTSTSVTSLAVL